MKYILWLLRVIVGCLFIFSGLVKANDPLGLVYKMKEFFEVLHMNFMEPFAFVFSITMIAFEIIAGVAVLLGYAFRAFSVLLLLLNMLFTFLTAYALFTDKVKECGCFGACIKISNTQTFWKDVILLAFAIILFAYRKRVMPLFGKYVGTSIMVIVIFLSFGIQWWALEHLPYYDCLAYKVGNNIPEKMKAPTGPGIVTDSFVSVMIYEKDGVKKEFNEQNYPWQDSTWKFVDRTVKQVRVGNAEADIKDFVISDYDGNDQTQNIVTTPGYVFLFFVKDARDARTDNMDRIRALIPAAEKFDIPTYVLCSSPKDEALAYQKKQGLDMIPFYQFDGTVSKTAMRSNPGLMLIKNGTIMGKWSYRDYPKSISMDNGKLNWK